MLILFSVLIIALFGDWQIAAAATCGTYIVRPGDSLLAISAKLDVSAQGLMQVNGLSNARALFSGQALAIACEAPSPGRAAQNIMLATLSKSHPTLLHPKLILPQPRYAWAADQNQLW